MVNPQIPFLRAVEALRTRLRSGRLVQGERLMAAELCRDLALSSTPVREALARLAGEGLIEDRRGEGYFAWRMDAVDLVELYDLQAAYLRMAVEAPGLDLGPPPPAEPPGDDDALGMAEALMLAVIRRGRSIALRAAHLRLADLLAPARRIEPAVLPDVAGEWIALAWALAAGDVEALRAWIDGYLDRRRKAAPALVAALRSAAAGPGGL